MQIKEELDSLTKKLTHQREEIELKLHLAELDAKKEWEKAEYKWKKFEEKLEEIADETIDTTEELVDATKVIGEELKSAYKRIVERLSD